MVTMTERDDIDVTMSNNATIPDEFREEKVSLFIYDKYEGGLGYSEKIYDLIPVKKEVKATISGIYITAVKGVRGPLDVPEKKKGFFARLRNK